MTFFPYSFPLIAGYQWNPNQENYRWRKCDSYEATKKNCPRGEPCLADTRSRVVIYIIGAKQPPLISSFVLPHLSVIRVRSLRDDLLLLIGTLVCYLLLLNCNC